MSCCDDCPKRNNCTEICSLLNKELPNITDGSFEHFHKNLHLSNREIADRIELARVVWYNRNILPKEEREVIKKFYYEQKDIFEIGKELDISPNHVRGLIKRAYNTIRDNKNNRRFK